MLGKGARLAQGKNATHDIQTIFDKPLGCWNQAEWEGGSLGRVGFRGGGCSERIFMGNFGQKRMAYPEES